MGSAAKKVRKRSKAANKESQNETGKAVPAMQTVKVNAQFVEDDSYIKVGLIEDQRKEFLHS